MAQKFKNVITRILFVYLFVQSYMPFMIIASPLNNGDEFFKNNINQNNERAISINSLSNSEKEFIEIDNPNFKLFVDSLIQEAVNTRIDGNLSDELLRCYEQLILGNKDLAVTDLKAALPDLMKYLLVKIEETRAPRLDAQGLNNGIVGPLVCDVSALQRAFDQCCTALERDFQLTFSLLNVIINNLNETSIIACVIVPVTQALVDAGGGTLVINEPGNYIFAEDIISSASIIILINSDAVTIDFCNRTLLGSGSTAVTGIQINPGFSNIMIENGEIDQFSGYGIHVLNGVFNLTIRYVSVYNCALSGIFLDGFGDGATTIMNSFIQDSRASFCATAPGGAALGGLTLLNCNNIIVAAGMYNQNGSALATESAGVLVNQSVNCRLKSVFMDNNTGISAQGMHIVSSTGNIITSCIANDNSGIASVNGFLANDGTQNSFINCTASRNTAPIAYGLSLGSNETLSMICKCIAETNIGTTPFAVPNGIFGAGIMIDSVNGASFNEILSNVVIRNNQSGIFDNAITFDATPVVITGASTSLVSGNKAVDNGLSGPAFATATPFRNYTVAYPTGSAVQTVMFRYSTGAAPVVSSAGDTMISNIDARFGV